MLSVQGGLVYSGPRRANVQSEGTQDYSARFVVGGLGFRVQGLVFRV